MRYRIYTYIRSYKEHAITSDKNKMIQILDNLIYTKKVKKILVIREDSVNNYDDILFLYLNDITEYEEFKKQVKDKVKILGLHGYTDI